MKPRIIKRSKVSKMELAEAIADVLVCPTVCIEYFNYMPVVMVPPSLIVKLARLASYALYPRAKKPKAE